MGLRGKTVAFMLAMAAVLIAALYIGTGRVLLNGVAEIERANVADHVRQVRSALDDELGALGLVSRDWGVWTETYRYLEGQNPTFPAMNLYPGAISELGFHFAGVLDNQGRLAAAVFADPSKGAAVPPGLRAYLRPENPLFKRRSLTEVRAEVTWLPEGPLLVAAAPVLTNELRGPSLGSLVMARFLDAAKIAELETVTGLRLELYGPSTALSADAAAARAYLASAPRQAVTVRTLSTSELAGYALVENLSPGSALLLRVTAPRPVFAQARHSRTYMVGVIVALCLGFLVLTLHFLQRVVLGRFAAIGRGLDRVARQGGVSGRVALAGRDEFARLAGQVDAMLEVLERTQRELQDSETRYALAVAGMNDGLWDCDVVTGEVYYSAR